MKWLYLLIAICFEVLGTSCMKLSYGLTKLWPSLGIFFFYSIAFVFLTLAIKSIDLSIAYAVWAGVGTVAIVFIDLFLFNTHLSLIKIFGIVLILGGTIILKVTV